MTIFDQIIFWIKYDSLGFMLTVLFSLLFFNGVLPVWIDKIKDLGKEDPDDLM